MLIEEGHGPILDAQPLPDAVAKQIAAIENRDGRLVAAFYYAPGAVDLSEIYPESFPPDIYYLDRIPTRIDMRENVVNFGITLLLGGLMGFVPGVLAALRPPLKAIRHD